MLFSSLRLCDNLASVIRLYTFHIPILSSEPHIKMNRIFSVKVLYKVSNFIPFGQLTWPTRAVPVCNWLINGCPLKLKV